jgi:SAM-dependent methyltransferase
MNEPTSSDHAARNREEWDRLAAEYFVQGRDAWASDEPFWGIWHVPESQAGVLPEKLEDRDAVEFGLDFPLVQADAEAVPLRSESFDLVISEYGASIWCDPYRWVPEAARLLRPGGELIFLVNGTILMLSVPDLEADGPATERLLRPYFGMHRFEWPDDPAVDFHLGYGDWIRLLRTNGLEVTDLIEVRPSEGSTTRYPFVTLEWAQRWPCEEVWKARKAR